MTKTQPIEFSESELKAFPIIAKMVIYAGFLGFIGGLPLGFAICYFLNLK